MKKRSSNKKSQESQVGSVLVVGGGIGGMQAALDLADSGFKTYLLEEKPAIGGVMAQLDKTFPTNDCSMCIMSPKLVDVGRHPNIDLITYAELQDISGSPGNFQVKIHKKSSFVDNDKCTGCGECDEVCPVSVCSEFEHCLSNRHAIFKMYPQAIPNVFTIDKLEGTSPCKVACPASINAQGYVQLIAQKKFKEALEIIRETNPFPTICGRVCHHPCEDECLRGDIDDPVAINPLKRFATDYVIKNGEDSPEVIEPWKKEKIAVVGAGPSGLTCALRLLEMGYPVTVFESSDKPGGMMTSCLPDYRIPSNIAMYDVNRILDRGVELKTNTTVGKDVTFNDLKKEFAAVYVAVGSQNPASLNIEGFGLKGSHLGIDLLREMKKGKRLKDFGKKVIIIGGGNVAIDCAKSAFRYGAREVHLVCLESCDLTCRDRMPAHDWEIQEAVEEGVIIHDSLGPGKIIGKKGKVTGLETVVCTSVLDDEGKFSPQFSDEPAPTIEGDSIILAIGQRPDLTGLEEIETTPGKTIEVDEVTLGTNIPGVFAGGDIVLGPSSVVEAVGHGAEAAVSIDRYLNNQDLRKNRGIVPEKITEIREEKPKQPREVMRKAAATKRKQDFREIELGFSEKQAIREAERCLSCSICSECMQCVEACEAEAIDHEMKDKNIQLNVGSIILAPGFETFDATLKSEYGYGRYQNVVNSVEFERILSASGPFAGHIVRPSDKKEPKKIAWIQCVGSRDNVCGKNYCSSVCCTYAIKEAVIAKEHAPEIEPTIFYMDMRTFGKGFEAYYNRAEEEQGVRFVRCRISTVQEDFATQNLSIKYETEEGVLKEEDFDMVVLSVGLSNNAAFQNLAKKIGVQVNEFGFCHTTELNPVTSTQPGIFVCGAFSGPKDIPETVTEASGAAIKASGIISAQRNSLIEKKEYPPEIDVSGQDPRIGLFICHCGINIGAYVNVPSLVEYAKTLPHVAYAEENLYTCSQDTQHKIVEKIKEHNLNRIIVASCTPRTHEPLFQETIREAGLNSHLFEMANIRDQCSWVHMGNQKDATEKSKTLIKMAVSKAQLIEPLTAITLPVTQKALVIGGGLAGMTSALAIADQGFEVYLVEKEKTLGGNLRNIHWILEDRDIPTYLHNLIEKVEKHPNIKIYTKAQIANVDGYIGNYSTTLKNGSAQLKLDHGVAIVATGAEEFKPTEYLYGKDKRVMTQLEFEDTIAKNTKFNKKTIVMIQCVGSREKDRPYCSRICCTDAIKNAIKVKEKHPDAQIFILYRDMRTYAFRETYYEKAREMGIVFVRYDKDKKPKVSKGKRSLDIETYDMILNEKLLLHADYLVLSSAIIPREGNSTLAKHLKVPLNADNFFLEAHVKLRPVDFATEGIYLAGMAHSPKSIGETITQSYAAASRALTIISKDTYVTDAPIAEVNEDLCSGCGVCLSTCPYSAIEQVTKKGEKEEEIRVSHIIEGVCKGCGSCVAACPSGAIEQKGFKRIQISSMVDAAVS